MNKTRPAGKAWTGFAATSLKGLTIVFKSTESRCNVTEVTVKVVPLPQLYYLGIELALVAMWESVGLETNRTPV